MGLMDYMNKRYEERREEIIRTGEKKMRSWSDEQLDRYESSAYAEGNTLRQEIAQRARDRRG